MLQTLHKLNTTLPTTAVDEISSNSSILCTQFYTTVLPSGIRELSTRILLECIRFPGVCWRPGGGDDAVSRAAETIIPWENENRKMNSETYCVRI